MERPTDASALAFDGVITQLARKRCRMPGIEMDDLVQEARLQVWDMLLRGETPTEQDLINSMRRWMRACREGRAVVYGTKSLSV